MVWPSEKPILEQQDGCLLVPVYTAIRKHADDSAYYIMGPNVPYDRFADIISSARLVTVRRGGDGDPVPD